MNNFHYYTLSLDHKEQLCAKSHFKKNAPGIIPNNTPCTSHKSLYPSVYFRAGKNEKLLNKSQDKHFKNLRFPLFGKKPFVESEVQR